MYISEGHVSIIKIAVLKGVPYSHFDRYYQIAI